MKIKSFLTQSLFVYPAAAFLLFSNPTSLLSAEDTPRASSNPTAISRFEVPLFLANHDRLAGALSKKDYLIHLPEHIRQEPGSELILGYRASPLLQSDVSTLSVSLNGRELSSIRLGSKKTDANAQEENTLTIPIGIGLFLPGWNRITVNCLLQTTDVLCRDVDNPAAWVELEPASAVRVAYSHQPLFPEIQRFPEAIAEPQWMSLSDFRASASKIKSEPVISILLPSDAGESELRSLLICAARLGQTGYLRRESIATGDLSSFLNDALRRNGILIGTKETLAGVPLPKDIQKSIQDLKNGEGSISEIITGDSRSIQRRWMILAGGDKAGLENAALTLGSATAMRGVPSNPWIIAAAPVVSPIDERVSQPTTGAVKLQSLRDADITLRGLFRQSTDRELVLPPGFETGAGSFVDLNFSHAGNLDKTSAFQVMLNDAVIGGVPLTAENAVSSRRRLVIPAGITGRDPSRLAISSYMDIGTVDCAHRHDERAWLNISGASLVDINFAPIQINDLSRLDRLCLRDAFLRQAAILVPEEAQPERSELLKAIGLFLGSKLPSMPVLWPQVATYGPGVPPSPERIGSRSGLVLGSAFQWADAFAKKTNLVIEGFNGKSDTITLRGEQVPSTDFDSSLSFAQLLKSPWSKGGIFAAVGGIENYGGDTTIALLTDPDIAARLSGTVAAVDSEKRVVTYDVRFIQEVSLSQQLRQGFVAGASLADSENIKQEKVEAGIMTMNINNWIIVASIALLAVLFLIQRLAVHRRKKQSEGREL